MPQLVQVRVDPEVLDHSLIATGHCARIAWLAAIRAGREQVPVVGERQAEQPENLAARGSMSTQNLDGRRVDRQEAPVVASSWPVFARSRRD